MPAIRRWTRVHFPASLLTIGDEAFAGCTGLDGQLILPIALTELGTGAFGMCSQIRGELVLPARLRSIESQLFTNMAGITSLVISSGLMSVAEDAFYACAGIESVTFLGSAPYATKDLLRAVSSTLKTVYVPAELRYTYVAAVSSFSQVSLRVIGVEADFVLAGTMLVTYQGQDSEITVPDGVTEIAANAFQGNKNCKR